MTTNEVHRGSLAPGPLRLCPAPAGAGDVALQIPSRLPISLVRGFGEPER